MIEEVGEISLEVINLLDLSFSESVPIYIGETNIAHMAREHGYEFNRYYKKIPYIIETADYVRLKKDDGSIEYIKFFGKYIKVAVRVAGDGNYYARSLYYVRNKIIKRLIKDGELKKLTRK